MSPMRSISGRLARGLLALFIVAGVGFALATWAVTVHYHDEVAQKLNRTLAANLVAEWLPLHDGMVDRGAVAEMFHLLMVVNPQIEIYLLDRDGRVLEYSAPPGRAVRQHVDVEPIRRFLSDSPALPIRGDDPRSAARRKVFSAAPVPLDGLPEGYVYVILGGEHYDSLAAMLRGSYVLRLALWGSVAGIGATLIGAFMLFGGLTHRLRRLDLEMERFRRTGFEEPPPVLPPVTTGDEIDRLSGTFWQMAERISAQVQALRSTDTRRRALVANISHDLRTPLASIQGYLETLLLKGEMLGPAERHQHLETATRQARRLSLLVGKLFELARLDSREHEPEFETFAPGELLQDVVQKFRLEAEERDVRLDVDFGQDVPFVVADVGLIERAVSNLVENALRHTPASGTVRLAVSRQASEVEIRITDTGTGIPVDALPQIFDRYYQLERSQRRASDRAGLGLAIVKRIIELHGGAIDVSSTPGVATSFAFRLPVAPPATA